MMQQSFAYVFINVGGIQEFIFATGKLKEMIGASQIINDLSGPFLQNVLERAGLSEAKFPSAQDGWYVLLQANAGAIRLVLRDERSAASFLTLFSGRVLESYPGLPVYGVQVPLEWSAQGLKQAAADASGKLDRQRASIHISSGMPLLPFVESSPLDALPATGKDAQTATTWVSLPSCAKTSKKCINAANDRLKSQFDASIKETLGHDADIIWHDDMDDMLADAERARLALIHIDGNDLGKAFRGLFEAAHPDDDIRKKIERTKAFSDCVSHMGTEAFRAGLCATVREDQKTRSAHGGYSVPLRPLVMGGDDLTLFVRADLAFAFVRAYVEAFEQAGKEAGKQLSVGVGMVLMPAGYPFVKAYQLVEQLLENAKNATLAMTPRPGSLDFLVLSGDVPSDLAVLRAKHYSNKDGQRLTAKPLSVLPEPQGRLTDLDSFIANAREVLHALPRSHTRNALNACRMGRGEGQRAFEKLRENLDRGLGGRHDAVRVTPERFAALFSPNSFFLPGADGREYTALADYVELAPYLTEVSDA